MHEVSSSPSLSHILEEIFSWNQNWNRNQNSNSNSNSSFSASSPTFSLPTKSLKQRFDSRRNWNRNQNLIPIPIPGEYSFQYIGRGRNSPGSLANRGFKDLTAWIKSWLQGFNRFARRKGKKEAEREGWRDSEKGEKEAGSLREEGSWEGRPHAHARTHTR